MNKAVRSKIVPRMVSGPEIVAGVFGFHWMCEPGESTVGMQLRTNASMMTGPKEKHLSLLKQLRAQKAPNLAGL